MTATEVKVYLVLSDPENVQIPTSGFSQTNAVLPPMKKVTETVDGVETSTWVQDTESATVGIVDRFKGLRYSGRMLGGRPTGHSESEVDQRITTPWNYIGDDPLLQGRQYYLLDVVVDDPVELALELMQLVQAQAQMIGREIAKPEGRFIMAHQIPQYFEQ